MIISAAILSKNGDLFCSNHLPYHLKIDISKHANNFLYALKREDEDIEIPYIEAADLRYIFKQTGDLYWLLVTKPDSEMFSDIHLLGRFVSTIMEYGSSETTSSSLTDEQRELFYRHIWRPWDDGGLCSFCGSNCNSPDMWEREFESRVQFLISIKDGDIDDGDVIYYGRLIDEAWTISTKIYPKWVGNYEKFNSDVESSCSDGSHNESISEEALIDGCRLKCRFDDIRMEVVRLQDPYLRLFARRDLMEGTIYDQNAPLCSAPSLKDLDLTDQSGVDLSQTLRV